MVTCNLGGCFSSEEGGLSKSPIQPAHTTNLVHGLGTASKSSFPRRGDKSHFPSLEVANLTCLDLIVNTNIL